MLTTNQTQPHRPRTPLSRFVRVFALVALALTLAVAIETTIALTRRSAPSHSAVAAAQQQYRDPYAGGYRTASGQLLWRETHVNASSSACVRMPRGQSHWLDAIEPYVMADGSVRVIGGQYAARLIAVESGTALAC